MQIKGSAFVDHFIMINHLYCALFMKNKMSLCKSHSLQVKNIDFDHKASENSETNQEHVSKAQITFETRDKAGALDSEDTDLYDIIKVNVPDISINSGGSLVANYLKANKAAYKQALSNTALYIHT